MKLKVIVAIVCITILIGYALYLGYDGVLLSSGLMLIAGLAGYEISQMRKPK